MTVARIFINMLLLKAAPQNLPYSYGIMNRVIFLYFISGIFVQSSVVEPVLALNMMVLNVFVLLIFSYVVLLVRQLKARFVQTASALFGTGIIFNLLLWPFIGLTGAEGSSDFLTTLLALLMLSMLSWELLVTAHIYRNALNLKMTLSIMLSLALFFISIILVQIFFPESS